jgi:hypothetical protein
MKKELVFLVVLSAVFLVPLASAGFINWITGKTDFNPTDVTIGINNTAPKLVQIFNTTGGTVIAGTPSEQDKVNIIFNFQAYDWDNSTDLNDSSTSVKFSKGGEPDRITAVPCTSTASAGRYRNYSCTVSMWYWDKAGDWDITATVSDYSGAQATNNTVKFTYNYFLGFKLNPTNITWPTLVQGATNQASDNDPSYLNNTGNNLANVTLKAIDLMGNLDETTFIMSQDFKVSASSGQECSGTQLVNNTQTLIKSPTDPVTLNRGNLSAGSFAGQQRLYYCLTTVNDTLTKQTYSTTKGGAWTITVVQAP